MKLKRVLSFILTAAILLSFFPGMVMLAGAAEDYNQLVNGNFDQGETGWGKNSHFTVGSVTDGVLVLPTTKTPTGDAIFYQSMNLAPGTYQLTFDGKGTANQYRPILYIGYNQWNMDYGQHFLKDFGFGEQWKTATVQFTIPESVADPNTGLAPVFVSLWTSNGSYAPDGEMQLDNFAVRKLLTVTTDLSNATLSNAITTVAQGESYMNTVTANAGYEVSKVIVTMGGTEVANAYDPVTGKISISSVTADLHIQVETDAADAGNLLVNGSFNQGTTGWANNGIAPAATISGGVLTLFTEKTASGDARTYNAMQLAPGSYQLSFKVKGTPGQYRPYVSVSKNYWTNDYGQYFMYQYSLSDTEWTTITETFTVPESAADGNTGLAPVYVTIWSSNSSYAPVTEMQFDNFAVRKLLKVTTDLSNASLSTGITTVTPGQSYVNTVTANAGYEVSKVTVTMGGTEVANAYNAETGKISISNVTADLHIQVETAAVDTDNLLVNGNFSQGATGWANNGTAPTATISGGILKVSTEKTASGDARTYNTMNLAPGVYQLTFDVKGTPAQYRPIVGVSKNYWTYDYGQYFMYQYSLSDTEWTTITETFTVPESAADANTGLAPVVVTIWGSNASYAPATQMQFDNFAVRKLLKVTTDLSNAALSTNITAVAPGQSYANTVTANAGYEVSKVIVTMGGVEVTNAYNAESGKISIANVTADLHIQVETTEVIGYNLLTNGNFSQGNTGWASNAATPAATIANGVLTLSTGKTSSGDARTYATLQLAPGAYELSFDVKGTPAQYRPIVGVSKNYWSYDYGQYFMYQYSLSDTQWTTITESFVVPESAVDANTGLAPVVITIWSSNASFAPLSEMQFDNFAVRKALKVTTELSNAKLSADIKAVVSGQSYENTVIANAGYEVSKVTVTMGGVEVANAYNAKTGKISITNVTADLYIQVETAEVIGYNLFTNGDFSQGTTGWASNAIAPAATIANGVLTLSTQKTASGDARTYATLQLAPGAYELSFDVKGTPAQYRPIVGVGKNYWSYDYGQYFMYDYDLSDTQWTTVKESFIVPESAVDANTGFAPVVITIWSSNTSYAPVTEMQFDNFAVRKGLQVTTELNNASLSEDIKAVVSGQSYVNTVTANPGYELSKVTVTMGGVEVAKAYNKKTGKISISKVTADLHIQVETTKVIGYNLLANGNFSQGTTGWASNAVKPAATISNGVLKLSTEKTESGDARTYYTMQLAPGSYQLSFKVKGTPAEYRPYVSVSKNYWTNDYGQYFMYDYGLSDSKWTTITEFFTVPESDANPSTGLAPVYITIWSSNTSYAPLTKMYFDDFEVYKCFDVIVQNPDGKEATGLAEFTIPYAVDGQAFEMVLAPETSEYNMKVSCTMSGVNVPVTVNEDGTVTIRTKKVSDVIVITVDSRKSAYDITNGEGIINSNPVTSVAHGAAYSAEITCGNPNKKLYALSYTMSRKTVDVPVVDGVATINIEAVTGDITITPLLVDKNMVTMWIFDVSKTVKGIGDWGDKAETIAIAHNGYYDGKNTKNKQPICTTEVAPDLLSVTTNLPSTAVGWAEASTVIGYKLPEDLELGATYFVNLPIYAGDDDTTLVSSKNKSKRSGMELVFTTIKPENMWNAGDKTVTRIYADGAGVLAASTPSRGKLTTSSDNVFRISFTVTEKIKEYAVTGNYLTLVINHQHSGSYKIGNASLTKITDPVKVTFKIGQSDCDGARVVQRGDFYTAQIAAKPENTLGSVSYTMDGKTVKVPVKKGVARIKIDKVTGDIVITATTWSNKPAEKPAPKLAVISTRPSPSPYNDYPYICDEEYNLMPNFDFESETNYLENTYSKIVEDANAWDGKHSLHYAPIITGKAAENLLSNGDFAKWNKAKKTISDWEFNNESKMNKLEFVELDGRHAVKLLQCGENEDFNMEIMQRVYLEADFTYTFSFDFYGVAHWGPNLVIYDEDMKHISTMNAKTTGTDGEWTTLSTTYRPTESGYYVFAIRIHNAKYPQKEQYISNCAVMLKSTRVEYELEDLKPDTNYWLTMLVKASKEYSVENSFITFGMTVPETGNFLLMADPSSEGGRPYKTGQQLVPMAYDGQWHILTVPFNTKECTELNFTIDGLNCEVWFDNIYIFEEANAKPFVSPVTDKGSAFVKNRLPKLAGCPEAKNLFENYDLNDGDAFWGDDSRKFGLFGNAVNIADSGSQVYGNALHYASDRPTGTYYIKWIDVEPNTDYTFSAKYAIAQPGEGFMGLINGYRLESEVTENRLFPTVIKRYDFDEKNYLESLAWQTAAITFNSGERNRIGFVICDAGGEAYIDELRLFKSSDGIALEDVKDTLPGGQAPAGTEVAPVIEHPEETDVKKIVLWSLLGVLLAAVITVSLIIIQKKRKN